MVRAKFYGWVIEVDTESTRALYPADCRGESNCCGCYECRNFAAQKLKVVSHPLCQFLRSIGVDPMCEKEVAYYGESEFGLHRYHVIYDYVGDVIKCPEELDRRGFVRVSAHTSLHICRSFIEFWIEAPWLIESAKNLSHIEFDVHKCPGGKLEVSYSGVPEGLNAKLALIRAEQTQLVQVLYEGSASSYQTEINTLKLPQGEYFVQLRILESDHPLTTKYITFKIGQRTGGE